MTLNTCNQHTSVIDPQKTHVMSRIKIDHLMLFGKIKNGIYFWNYGTNTLVRECGVSKLYSKWHI
jgi:hypothetical protein